VLRNTKYTAVSNPDMEMTSCSVADIASRIHANGLRVLEPPSQGTKPFKIRFG
jgi:hypothetical protein